MFVTILALNLALQATSAAPTDIGAVIAEGDRLLEAANAGDLFVNESGDGSGAIILRHKASGYRCVLNPGKSVNAVKVFAAPVRGDDVASTTETVSDIRSIYFTRSARTTAQESEAAAQAIRSRYRNCRPANLTGNRGIFVIPGQIPEHVTLGFDTAESYEQVTVGVTNGWAVKFRYSSPPGTSFRSGVLEGFWVTTMLEPAMLARRAAAGLETPQGVGPEGATPEPTNSTAD